MKKFLLILLVAIAASVKVEFDGTELQGKWKDFWKKVWDFLKTIPEKLRAVYHWLKDKGNKYIDFFTNRYKILDLLDKYGAPKAIEWCIEKTGWNDLCRDFIEKAVNWLR